MEKKHKTTKSEKIQVALLILIGVFICALIVAIVVFVDNAEEVRSEPVQYAIDNTDLDWCTCMDEDKGIVVDYPRGRSKEGLVIQNWTG